MNKTPAPRAAASSGFVETERRGQVAFVWLNRPDLRNAFNEVMIAELDRALRRAKADTAVRVVVLAGRGVAFCAGADLHWMQRMAGFTRAQNEADAGRLARMLRRLATIPKPTIARVHGAAFAGAVGLIAACDLALAAQEAQFAISEVRLGLQPATISPYVIGAIGERSARRYFLSGERFSAEEALRIGLVHAVVPAAELDNALAGFIANLTQGSPAAQAGVKELVRKVSGARIDARLIAMTARRIAEARASDDGKEGTQAFLQRRPPSWAHDGR
jgi:methylglutaconyl-CoA hydratase